MRSVPKWILLVIAVSALLILKSRDWAAPLWAGTGLLATAIPLLAAAALGWFVFHMCLGPRLRLKKLQRIRVRQGRRHPLA